MSPDSPEAEPEYSLTPRTEAKYSKIDEEFQMMMQRNQLNGSRVGVGGSNYNLPVSVPVGSYDQSLLQASPQMHTSISPRPSSSETDSGKHETLGCCHTNNRLFSIITQSRQFIIHGTIKFSVVFTTDTFFNYSLVREHGRHTLLTEATN